MTEEEITKRLNRQASIIQAIARMQPMPTPLAQGFSADMRLQFCYFAEENEAQVFAASDLFNCLGVSKTNKHEFAPWCVTTKA